MHTRQCEVCVWLGSSCRGQKTVAQGLVVIFGQVLARTQADRLRQAAAKANFSFPLSSFSIQSLLSSLCRGSSPVERGPEKAGVGSSTLPLGTMFSITYKRKRQVEKTLITELVTDARLVFLVAIGATPG